MTDEEREDLNTFKHDLVKQARWWQWKAEMLEKENEQLKSENAALRERLEKAVELPFKIGEKVWHFEYDEFDEKYDIVCRIFVGGNNEYAFLSPAIYTGGQDLKDAYSICDYYYNEYKENDDECICIVIPYEECFATREAAEARLTELKGGKE